mmetsp:Transcript_3682/g.5158  ORF Transcript_3682/g.5158 Transcript_3682/m.5158 type:complete len:226 (+) Transcript_3682:856-1533(+)
MVADAALQPLDRLQVVREHVQPGGGDLPDERQLPAEVGREALHQHARPLLLDAPHGGGEVRGPLVGLVVAVHRGQHHVVQAPLRNRLGGVLGLLGVERRRRPVGLHRAEAAAARARVPHDHDGSRRKAIFPAAPAFANVRALSLLANRSKAKAANGLSQPCVVFTFSRNCFQPSRFWSFPMTLGNLENHVVCIFLQLFPEFCESCRCKVFLLKMKTRCTEKLGAK